MKNDQELGQTVFSGKLFTVKHIRKTLSDGKEKTYELIDIQSAITLLPMDAEKNIHFVEQYRIGSNKPLLELPAGKIEPGENPLNAARRELREEIGMDATEIRHLGNFYMTPGYANEYMYCFLATGLFQAPLMPDADEFIRVIRIPINKVKEMIKNGEIEDSKTLAALMLAVEILH